MIGKIMELLERSMSQRTRKYFGDDFVEYLVGDTSKIISYAYSSPETDHLKETIKKIEFHYD